MRLGKYIFHSFVLVLMSRIPLDTLLMVISLFWIIGAMLSHIAISISNGPPPSELKAILMFLLRWPELIIMFLSFKFLVNNQDDKKTLMLMPDVLKIRCISRSAPNNPVVKKIWLSDLESDEVRTAAFKKLFCNELDGFELAAINATGPEAIVVYLDGTMESSEDLTQEEKDEIAKRLANSNQRSEEV